MASDSIAPYVSGAIDAGKELRALGNVLVPYFLYDLQRVAMGRRGYRNRRPFFTSASGVPVYKIDRGDCFIGFVVEPENDGGACVTLIYAGRAQPFAFPNALPGSWDAASVTRARQVIEPRVEDFIR